MTATCHLHALSAYAPDTVLTNDDLAKLVDKIGRASCRERV